jgi:TRAP-type mannitol/chloroaromatic compound transport system permease small subunit
MLLQSFPKIINNISIWVAKVVRWLLIILAVIVVYETIRRNLFGAPTAWALSLSYQLYAAIFMLGAAHTLSLGAHLRISFLWEGFSSRKKAACELVFYLAIFFPMIAIFSIYGTEWAWDSWKCLELEPPSESNWMEPIYPFKTILPVAFYLLGIQGITEFLRNLFIIVRRRENDC